MIDIGAAVTAFERILARYRHLSDTESRRQASDAALKTAADAVRECERRHYKYFEEIYYTEEKRRDAFTTTFSFLLGLLGIAGAIASFYLRDVLEWLPETTVAAIAADWTVTVYLVFLLFDVAFLGAASCFLIRALHGYTYQYLATPLQVRQHYKDLLAHYGTATDAEREFHHYLTEQYAAAANTNDQNNITRRTYQYWCMGSTIYLFISLALTLVPFFGHKVVHREKQPILIKWDNARVTLDAPTPSPLVFDKEWPSARLSFGLESYGKPIETPPSNAAPTTADTNNSTETKATSPTAPIRKGFLPKTQITK
jgi:hypothetical protein